MSKNLSHNINYEYLRPKKAEHLKKLHKKDFCLSKPLSAVSYKDAIILPINKIAGDRTAWGRGGVVDSNLNYVKNSGIPQLIDLSYSYSTLEEKDEKVVYCGYLIMHWGHFLVDAVSRLWYFLKNDLSIDKYVFIVEKDCTDNKLYGNYKEFFSLLGVLDKIEIVSQPTKYKEVIVPDLGYDRSKNYSSDEYNQIFECIANNAMKVCKDNISEFPKKIFLTRSQLGKSQKMEFGVDMLDNYFGKNGYKVIAPEKNTLSELICLIRNADVCAAVSGTLPHNMLFAKDGQSLMIVERNALNNIIQVDVNLIKKLDVVYIDGNISLYPVELAYGPFIFCFNKILKRFTDDFNYVIPDDKFLSDKFKKSLIKSYFYEYETEHGYKWYLDGWMIEFTDILYEAYLDGEEYFKEYLTQNKNFRISQYFRLRYIKKQIKAIIRKFIS